MNFHGAGGRVPANANDSTLLSDQPDDLGLHSQMKGWKAASLLGEEVQKVPLRHEHHEAAMRPEGGHIP
jgi:hypothetical protein